MNLYRCHFLILIVFMMSAKNCLICYSFLSIIMTDTINYSITLRGFLRFLSGASINAFVHDEENELAKNSWVSTLPNILTVLYTNHLFLLPGLALLILFPLPHSHFSCFNVVLLVVLFLQQISTISFFLFSLFSTIEQISLIYII